MCETIIKSTFCGIFQSIVCNIEAQPEDFRKNNSLLSSKTEVLLASSLFPSLNLGRVHSCTCRCFQSFDLHYTLAPVAMLRSLAGRNHFNTQIILRKAPSVIFFGSVSLFFVVCGHVPMGQENQPQRENRCTSSSTQYK